MTPAPATKIRALAARVDAATPAHRDRTVDALRALAICGVILGHWLVTALVLTPAAGTLRDASPLASMSGPDPGSPGSSRPWPSSSASADTRPRAATAAATSPGCASA